MDKDVLQSKVGTCLLDRMRWPLSNLGHKFQQVRGCQITILYVTWGAGSKDPAWKGNSASRQLEKKRKLELAKRPIDQVIGCQAPVQSPKRHKSRHSHSTTLMPGNRRQLAEREVMMLQEESRRQHEAELKMQNELRAKLIKSGIHVDTASDEAARVQESSTTSTAWHSSVACLRVLAWLESAEQMSKEDESKDSSKFPSSV
uniref:Uncharacterized protein n=1 Tax=Guillardia theta TaxID=55529 RepID=A0A6U6AUA7_GUITH|mmetsp:Transcript_34415/g.107930  ORF Transcript_34415/g.107930 Transcript_34415/m.107930 type:complete len:202 (+) Transcript_34415:714-1319(+)